MFLQKFVNALLFIYFLFITIVAPLFDGQTILPITLFPKFLVDLKSHYAHENGDYLVAEKPDFFIGLIWVELLVQWPLCIANLYAILTNKSWFKKTCLIYGVSTATGMVAILSELTRSTKGSCKLMNIYAPFMGFALIAILNGLAPQSKSVNVTRPTMARKKRA
ncbi:Transmembrane protein 6/97 [Macleaya cordata]|uniref:Transmembrane protein 6/97 n=1 Tax=Macleaya cordata TaxID=56857 RepID=A0A200QKQ4_MACCD|nr:Transmembrane protein 6/97 [Macleaya cordata]